jgi:RNA polymerase sigma-70 factor (ECF subfamily)
MTHVPAGTMTMSADGLPTWSEQKSVRAMPSPLERTDADLLRCIADGDADSFDIVLERYEGQIIGFLHRMLANREDALDGAQEVFVRVFTQAHRYEPTAPFRAWLYRIATNVGIDIVRKRKRRWGGLFPARTQRSTDGGNERDPLDDVAAGDQTALAGIIERERGDAIGRALATLPCRYREALVLRDLQDLSYEEVADVLGCRVGTVKSRINRARNLMRQKLVSFGEAS